MRELLQSLYDWVLKSSPEQQDRCNSDSPPMVRLCVRAKPVEGALEVNVRFFASDEMYLPATALPLEHRNTLVKMMRPPTGMPMCFRVMDRVSPGSTIMEWRECVFDEEIRVSTS